MKRILLFALSFIIINSTQSQNKKDAKSKNGSLTYLSKYNGKYPYEVKMFSKPQFLKRVKGLVGSRYKLIEKYWNVESPIEVNSAYFEASACRAHECSTTNFLILYNFDEDKMYVGIRENEKSQIYSENGKYIPLVLKEWSKEDNLSEEIKHFFDSTDH